MHDIISTDHTPDQHSYIQTGDTLGQSSEQTSRVQDASGWDLNVYWVRTVDSIAVVSSPPPSTHHQQITLLFYDGTSCLKCFLTGKAKIKDQETCLHKSDSSQVALYNLRSDSWLAWAAIHWLH